MVEEADKEKDLFVVDPDDYQKTKQLEAIHKAKEEVREMRSNRGDIINERSQQFRKRGTSIYRHELAVSIAKYGSELLPLIEEAKENGLLTEDDLTVECLGIEKDVTIPEYIRFEGASEEIREKDIDGCHFYERDSMEVYRQLTRIQRKLGLGLEMDVDKGAAEI
jgi:hypothetical protein